MTVDEVQAFKEFGYQLGSLARNPLKPREWRMSEDRKKMTPQAAFIAIGIMFIVIGNKQQSRIDRCRHCIPSRRLHTASQISEFGRRPGRVNDDSRLSCVGLGATIPARIRSTE